MRGSSRRLLTAEKRRIFAAAAAAAPGSLARARRWPAGRRALTPILSGLAHSLLAEPPFHLVSAENALLVHHARLVRRPAHSIKAKQAETKHVTLPGKQAPPI